MRNFLAILVIFALSNTALAAFEDPSAYMQRFEPKKKQELILELEQQKYKEELKERGYSQSVNEFINHVKKGHLDIVQLYINAGMSPDVNYYTDHPIYYAVKAGNYDMVKLLLENGARANIGFDSPLYFAVKKKNLPVVKILLQYGADANYSDFVMDRSMLYLAVSKGQYEIAKELIDAGAKIDKQTAALIEKKKVRDLIIPPPAEPAPVLDIQENNTKAPLPEKQNDPQE